MPEFDVVAAVVPTTRQVVSDVISILKVAGSMAPALGVATSLAAVIIGGFIQRICVVVLADKCRKKG